MASLQSMGSFASAGNVPLYEKRGRLCSVPLVERQSSPYVLEHYPVINLRTDMLSASTHKIACIDSSRNLLLPVYEGIIKRITRTFFESGFQQALTEARSEQTAQAFPIISKAATYITQALNLYEKLKRKVYPHTREFGAGSISRYAETRDWTNSYIRYIAWHPNWFKIAVAGSDDIIRIYTDAPTVVPMLKNVAQKSITCMAWRPLTVAQVAVGCEKGLCIWTIDNNMHITRSSSQTVFLEQPNHFPITSVQWNTYGILLATASIGDRAIIIWEIDKEQSKPLRRIGPMGSILKWSPDMAWLLAATVGNVFRVWTTTTVWTTQRWTIPEGTIKSACWSPCSSHLLFVVTTDSTLYRLQFYDDSLFQSGKERQEVQPLADLSKIIVGDREIGGRPQLLAWDPNGCFLAVIYIDSPFITIFRTNVQKFNLQISPSYYVSGIANEHPNYICFQSIHRMNKKSVLTIGWSSGRVEYLPLD